MRKTANMRPGKAAGERARQKRAARVYIGFWAEPRMKSAIQEEADSFRRSVSQQICAIIEDHFYMKGRR